MRDKLARVNCSIGVRRRMPGVCAIVMIMLCLCGCAGKSTGAGGTEELPTIRVMTFGDCSDTSLERISAALSEITAERIGCRISLETISISDYEARANDLIFDKDFPDIFVCPDRKTLCTLKESNYIFRLNRLLESHENLASRITNESDWSQSDINGYSYGIPFGNGGDYYWGFMMRADICDALQIDTAKITSLDGLYDALMLVHEKYPEVTPVASDYGSVMSFEQYDPLENSIGVLMYGQDTGTEIVNLAKTREFRELCTRMRQWYSQGLILENAAFNTISGYDLLKDGNAFGIFTKVSRYTRADMAYATGADIYCVPLSERHEDDTVNTESMCIYAYSPYYNLCMDFLELLYTDSGVLELCLYGQEGIDYVVTGETIASKDGVPVEGGRYFCGCWPNRSIARELTATGVPVSTEEWGGTMPAASDRRGFVFNDDSVRNEVYQCELIMDKYYYALVCGMIDPDEGISMLCSGLEAAGVDAVIGEKQRQFDLWLAQDVRN